MATTALKRLRELRKEETAGADRGSKEGMPAAGACPSILASLPEPPVWSQSAADVLDILVKAGAPMLHTALVAALAAGGHGKAAVRKAIADAQGRGWIEHNLTTGYVLSGEASEETK